MKGGRKRPRVPSPPTPTKDPKEEAEVASLACFSSNPAQSITEPRGDQDLFCISSYLGRLRVKTDPPFNTIPAITYPYWFLPGCFSSRPLSNKEFPPLRWNEVKSPWNAIYCTLDLVGGKHYLGKMFCCYVKSDISQINKGNNLVNCWKYIRIPVLTKNIYSKFRNVFLHTNFAIPTVRFCVIILIWQLTCQQKFTLFIIN